MTATLLPAGWWRDPWYRDIVQERIRGLIREGYSNSEVGARVGVDGNTVAKQRKRMGTR